MLSPDFILNIQIERLISILNDKIKFLWQLVDVLLFVADAIRLDYQYTVKCIARSPHDDIIKQAKRILMYLIRRLF